MDKCKHVENEVNMETQNSGFDPRLRYTINEACALLRVSRAYLYGQIGDDAIRVIRDGRRVYVPGSEILRRSTLPARAA